MAVSVKITGINQTFKDLDSELIKFVNTAQRANAFQAVSALQITTPVDTGRARGSWHLSQIENNLRDAGNGGPAVSLLGPIPDSKVEALYITNGTPYIEDLNAGTSLQAPPRFIEKTLSKYFRVSGNSIKVIKN